MGLSRNEAIERLIEACREVDEMIRESFRDIHGASGHDTEWFCPLCGNSYEHDDGCAAPKLKSALTALEKAEQTEDESEALDVPVPASIIDRYYEALKTLRRFEGLADAVDGEHDDGVIIRCEVTAGDIRAVIECLKSDRSR